LEVSNSPPYWHVRHHNNYNRDVTRPRPPDVPTEQSPAIRPIEAVVLAVAIAGGILLRCHYLNQPIKYDEALGFVTASAPLTQSLSRGYFPNNHLLYTILAHGCLGVLGRSEWAMRLPAMLAGVLMIPATWLRARRLYEPAAAVAAGVLVAVSSALVDHSTNGRGYTILGLVFILLVILGDVLRRGQPSARRRWLGWSAFAILGALGFYTIPVMLYPFGAVVAWLTIDGIRRDRSLLVPLALATLAAGLLTLLLYLPVIIGSGAEALFANKFVRPLTSHDMIGRLPGMLRDTWALWTRDVPRAIVAAGVVGVIASLVVPSVKKARPDLLLISIGWCAAAVLVQRVVPYPRVWLFLPPLIFAVAAADWCALLQQIWSLSNPFVAAAPVILLLGLVLGWQTWANKSPINSAETGICPSAPQIAHDLATLYRAGDRLVSHVPASAPLRFYCRREGLPKDLWQPTQDSPVPRLWVVVCEPDQSLDLVLKRNGIDPLRYKPADKVRGYPGATLYRMELRRAAIADTSP
jgi:hypothetical protein